MKQSYLYIATSFILIAIILYSSCSSKDKAIAVSLFREREYLLKEFKDKSVIGRGGGYQLSYYKEQSVNTFYFEKKDGVLTFTSDTIQYPINEIAAFKSVYVADSSKYRKVLGNELSRLINVMDNFKINDVSAEDRFAGVDMKIYFGDYKALLYVSNVLGIKNERWKNYVTSGEKLDDNWYYVKEE